MADFPERKIPESKIQTEDETEKEIHCGFRFYKPDWLRRFGTPRYFLLAFCLQNLLQGANVFFYVGASRVIQDHFRFSNKDVGYLIMTSEIGPILTSFTLSYYGGWGNRPRWLAAGMIMTTLGLLLTAVTAVSFSNYKQESNLKEFFCSSIDFEGTDDWAIAPYDYNPWPDKLCPNQLNRHLFFAWMIAHTLIGIGGTVCYVMGLPYLDDSIREEESPFYLALVSSARILGPLLGFNLARKVTKQHFEYVYEEPDLEISWTEQWWLGPVILGAFNTLVLLLLAAFPRYMIKPKVKPKFHLETEDGEIFEIEISSTAETDPWSRLRSSFFDVRNAFGRLYKNKVLLWSTFSDFFCHLAIAGFFLWLPTFLEHQFRITKDESVQYTGIATTSSVILGLMGCGLFIRQFRPSARVLVYVTVSFKAAFVICIIGIMFISCGFNQDLPGAFNPQNNTFEINNSCSLQCDCVSESYLPLCLHDETSSRTYFSPCTAGCSALLKDEILRPGELGITLPKLFRAPMNCSCGSPTGMSVTLGHCKTTCSQFTLFNMISVVINSFIAIGTIGSLMLTIRCVASTDKSLALGLKSTAAALAFFFTPVLYGILDQSSCLKYKTESCAMKTGCLIYDPEDLGYKLHGITALLLFISVACEIMVAFYAKGFNIINSSSLTENGHRKLGLVNSLRKALFKTQVKGDHSLRTQNDLSDSVHGTPINELVIKL